jgi:putative ABC transport system ATP-binding protein
MNETVIQLENIRRYFVMGDETVKALDGVNFKAGKGEFISIMGASGSGKSTLMNILGCLDKASSGTYLLAGINVNTLNQDGLAAVRNSKIGFVFQGFNLLPKTSALENVELPLLYSRDRKKTDCTAAARTALEKVGLEKRMKHLPSQLSGGQQQRVAIARALVSSPEIILADEPTGNLDSKTSDEIMHLFHELNEQGITIIMVTHEHDIAEWAKRIITVKDGSIISDMPGRGRK